MSTGHAYLCAKPSNGSTFFRLRLFVANSEPNSVNARKVLLRLCNTYLKDHHELQIVDVYEDYNSAIEHGIMAVPALIIESPPPRRTIVGSLTDEEKVLSALGLLGKRGQ